MPASTRPSLSRSDYFFLAKLAEEAERYDDVVTQLTYIAKQIDPHLTVDERSLLSVAYKNLSNNLRRSWRTVDVLEKVQSTRSLAARRNVPLISRQKEKIEEEIAALGQEIVILLTKTLIPAAEYGEETVFYHKMKGDYQRYLAEIAQGAKKERLTDQSLSSYKLAYKQAIHSLDAMHPTRLGLALNFAVFYHDCHKSSEKACHLAKHALDDAVQSLDKRQVPAHTIRDSLVILQLLRDDMILWSKDIVD